MTCPRKPGAETPEESSGVKHKVHPGVSKPTLRDYKRPSSLSGYPAGPCYEAGHLVTKNAGWRNATPVVDRALCKNCLQCYLYCPDGTIRKDGAAVAIDYDFCKGCGICAKICRFKAITMKQGGSL